MNNSITCDLLFLQVGAMVEHIIYIEQFKNI